MGFLDPAFLLGAAAVAVPILIHLVHRERREAQAFPSLMFLQRVPHRSVRSRRVRHWLLLALRCAGLVLLALAFARPVLTEVSATAGPEGGPRARLVLLDRSWSMGYADRWPRAVTAARNALAGLGPEDVSGVILFGETARASGALTNDHEALASTLGAARLSWEATRFAPALKVAARLLGEAGPERKELVVVSDFQKSGLEGVEDVRLPAGTDLRWVNLSSEDGGRSHHAITEVTLNRLYDRQRERVAVSARVVAQGEDAAGSVTATLELNGREQETRSVDVPGTGVVTVRFDPVPFPQVSQRGVVRLEPDALPQDDAFHFLLEPGRGLGVLVVERDGARSAESLFLRRALAIGDRPRFDVSVRRVAALRAADLEGVSVALLNDAPWPPGRAGEALTRFVNEGGGVVAALGPRSAPRGWSGPAAQLLPGRLEPRPVDRAGDRSGTGTLAALDYDHPVFELFSRPRSGDFSEARFMRYRSVSLDRGTALARFDDGAAALVEVPHGEGRLLFWMSSLDTLWNDLPLQPVFLPFVHRLVAHAARHSESPAWRRVGDVLELPEGDAVEWIGTAPDESRVRLEPGEGFFPLAEAGFYELRPAEESGAVPPVTVAVNADPTESDLSSADPEEFAGSLIWAGPGGAAGAGAMDPGEAERRQRVWWFVLLAALVVLASETALSNRMSREVR